MRKDLPSKRKIIISILIGILAIAGFGVGMHLIEKHGLLDEQFGDTGDWGSDGDDEVILTIGDTDYVSKDSINTCTKCGKQKEEKQLHSLEGNEGTCSGCDIKLCRIIANNDGKEQSLAVVKNSSFYTVPDKDVLGESSDDKAFLGWLSDVDGKVHKPGDTILVSTAVTLTAKWGESWSSLQEQINKAEKGSTITLDEDYFVEKTDARLEIPEDADLTLDLNGKTLSRNMSSSAAGGSVLYVQGKLTIKDSSSEGTGTIKGGRDNKCGGGVYVAGGSVIMENGTITGNTADETGGGVYIESGSFEMRGGAITGNTSYKSGGGVFAEDGSFVMTGGSVTGNQSLYGNGVYISAGSGITVSGDPVISNNTFSMFGMTSNLILEKGATIKVDGELDPNANIGVTVKDIGSDAVVITDGFGDNGSLYSFTSDEADKLLGYTENGEAVLGTGQCGVFFDENGGEGSMNAEKTLKDYYFRLPACGFEAPEGRVFDGWTVGNEIDKQPGDLIKVTEDVTIAAEWEHKSEDIYNVLASAEENRYAYADRSSGKTGDTVNVIALTPDEGYRFVEWEVTEGGVDLSDETSASTSFTIKNEDVVVNAVFEPIAVEEVTLNTTEITMNEGEKTTEDDMLTAFISPADALNKNLTWESSDDSVVSVEAAQEGCVLTAKKSGTATITVTTEDGGKTASCEVTVGHSHALRHVPAAAATCENDGNTEYWICDQGDHPCGKLFSDEAGTTEISESDVVVAATGHDWKTVDSKAATCTEKGYVKYECANDSSHTKAKEIAELGHRRGDVRIEDQVDPTCEEPGSYKKVEYCRRCGEVLSSETGQIEALGHEWTDWEVTKEATADQEGEEQRTCSRCNETETRVIPKTDHVHDLQHVDETAASCIKSGFKEHYECTTCGRLFTDEQGTEEVTEDQLRIAATGHKKGETKTEKISYPTCSSVGSSVEYTYCKVCGEVIRVENKIEAMDADAHDWGEWKVTKLPTVDAEGEKQRVCKHNSAHVEKSTISKLSPGSESVSLNDAVVGLSKSAFTYNKKVQVPKVVSIGGVVLKKGTDYTIKYSNASSKSVGTYKITITGKGYYSGKTSVSYTIKPKGTSLRSISRAKKALTVRWKKQKTKMATSRITGYQIQLATDKNFTKNVKKVTVKGYNKTSKKITKLKAKKKYYVRIRTYKTIKGVKYYSAWSKAKTAKTK